MSHMKVLDRSIFPAMSRRHIKSSRAHGGHRVLRNDDICQVDIEVWKELPSENVASGYIQAYRIASEVINAKCDNKFLGVGGCGWYLTCWSTIRLQRE